MKTAWFLAFIISASLAGAFLLPGAEKDRQEVELSFFALDRISPGATVIIGSSLTRNLLPLNISTNNQRSSSPKNDYVRVTHIGMTAPTATRLLEEAVNRGAGLVYVELNRYLTDLKRTENGFYFWFVQMSLRLRSAIRLSMEKVYEKLVSNNSVPNPGENFSDSYPRSTIIFDGKLTSQLKASYRRYLLAVTDRAKLQDVLRLAKRRDVKIVFFYPPQSQAFAKLNYSEFTIRLKKRQVLFGKKFNSEIWLPGVVWANRYFSDATHVNGQGRERFMPLFTSRMEKDLGRN